MPNEAVRKRRASEVTDAIDAYIREHGLPPTRQELARTMECSISTVENAIVAAEADNLIRKVVLGDKRVSRNYIPVESGRDLSESYCPTCGRRWRR